jgi:pentatricopeptide repeat protein
VKLPQASTPVIYEALRLLRSKRGQGKKIRAFVEYLVQDRKEVPNSFLYDALIASNWCHSGSAEEVMKLMDEMKSMGVEGSAGLYHTSLRVSAQRWFGSNVMSLTVYRKQALTAHPDYLLRMRLQQEMKERWIEISPEGRLSVCLALLRERQYELAWSALNQMYEDGIEVPSWADDIFLYAFGSLGFLDEALQMLRRRAMPGDGEATITLNVWYFLLDECSRAFHHEGTRFVWNLMIHTRKLTPSDGMCLNILNTAARFSDSTLATEVIQLLADRGAKLGVPHYEALVDCYAQSGDFETALQALCIINNSGIQPDKGSTRSIYTALRRSPGLTDDAVAVLFKLRAGHEVPISAFNVVVEAMCSNGETSKAIDLYQQVRQICSAGPNLQTFEPLVCTCTDVRVAMFLKSEMDAFSIRPTQPMFDALVRTFAVDGDLEAAFQCLWDMSKIIQRGSPHTNTTPWVSRATAMALIKRCAIEKDSRLWDVLETARQRGMDINDEVRHHLPGLPDNVQHHGPQETRPVSGDMTASQSV